MTVTNLSTQTYPPHELAAHKLAPLASSTVSAVDLLDRIAETIEFCGTNAAAIDRNGAFPIQEFESIARVGLLAAPLATKLGGLGLGIDSSSIHQLLTILQQIAIERAIKLANFFQIKTTMMEPTQSIIISYGLDRDSAVADATRSRQPDRAHQQYEHQ